MKHYNNDAYESTVWRDPDKTVSRRKRHVQKNVVSCPILPNSVYIKISNFTSFWITPGYSNGQLATYLGSAISVVTEFKLGLQIPLEWKGHGLWVGLWPVITSGDPFFIIDPASPWVWAIYNEDLDTSIGDPPGGGGPEGVRVFKNYNQAFFRSEVPDDPEYQFLRAAGYGNFRVYTPVDSSSYVQYDHHQNYP